MSGPQETQAVANFREYLTVKSDQPNPDYRGCVKLLKRLYCDLNVVTTERELVSGKPILLFTKVGSDPSLKSILLNSHMDVVPVTESKWKHEPFSGDKDTDGKIYGRGSQDCKCLGIQALEALRKLDGKKLLRTVHVSFVPDEEIGGHDGMAAWVKTDDFKKLNVGFALDESVIVPLPVYVVFNSERTMWSAEVTCRGKSGHGSAFHTNTAAEKLSRLLHLVMEFMSKEEEKFKMNEMGNWPEQCTAVNLTIIHGGNHHNVLPSEIKVTFDCRLAPTLEFKAFKQWFIDTCNKAGEGVSVDFVKQDPKWPVSPIDDSNPFWVSFKAATDKLKLAVLPITCPGTTDARFLRQVGIPSYGFTPMNQTPTLLHDHNEFVYEEKFLEGINIFEKVICSVTSIPADL